MTKCLRWTRIQNEGILWPILADGTSTNHVMRYTPNCNFKPRAHGAAVNGLEAPRGGEHTLTEHGNGSLPARENGVGLLNLGLFFLKRWKLEPNTSHELLNLAKLLNVNIGKGNCLIRKRDFSSRHLGYTTNAPIHLYSPAHCRNADLKHSSHIKHANCGKNTSFIAPNNLM